jgi:xanthine dehydrogenase molybdenum-binding subunit
MHEKNKNLETEYSCIGSSRPRLDASDNVRGRARFTADMAGSEMLQGAIVRSSIAHGLVTKLDVSQAWIPGVELILTPDNVTQKKFATSGHPYALDGHGEILDKSILSRRVRFYGEEIALVVAKDIFTARLAVSKILVEYETWPVYLDPKSSSADGAIEIQEGTNNLLGESSYSWSEDDSKTITPPFSLEQEFCINPVQHCHIENQICYAYRGDGDQMVVVTPNQAPHTATRILADLFEMPTNKVRVIKPNVGGGFGNKQEIVIEPLAMAASMALNGRAVMLDLTREEAMIGTRIRHPMKIRLRTRFDAQGMIGSRELELVSNNGSYASHGEAVAYNARDSFIASYIYSPEVKADIRTVYTNLPAAGAMRGYGIPQINFAIESHLDSIALQLSIDPVELRSKNMIQEGFVDITKSDMPIQSFGLPECIDQAKEYIAWDRKRVEYGNQTGILRRGIGLACFNYATGTWPNQVEIAGARVTLNQDGSIVLDVGATELGQGAQTVFCQMVAEELGIPLEWVYMSQVTDTQVSPFDTGAYASRQSYVSGHAVKKAAREVREQILIVASRMLGEDTDRLTLENGLVVSTDGIESASLKEIALQAYYHVELAKGISSDTTHLVSSNAIAYGVTVVEVEVDMATGRIDILDIANIHDSGKILNPVMAEGQVFGGMSMGLGMALSEQLLFNKLGVPLNNNLLDYKLPTCMDTPDLHAGFVETYEPTAPYGNKALGEPPVISPSAAIRNAVLHATGVELFAIPMNPQAVFEAINQSDI